MGTAYLCRLPCDVHCIDTNSHVVQKKLVICRVCLSVAKDKVTMNKQMLTNVLDTRRICENIQIGSNNQIKKMMMCECVKFCNQLIDRKENLQNGLQFRDKFVKHLKDTYGLILRASDFMYVPDTVCRRLFDQYYDQEEARQPHGSLSAINVDLSQPKQPLVHKTLANLEVDIKETYRQINVLKHILITQESQFRSLIMEECLEFCARQVKEGRTVENAFEFHAKFVEYLEDKYKDINRNEVWEQSYGACRKLMEYVYGQECFCLSTMRVDLSKPEIPFSAIRAKDWADDWEV